MIIKKKGVIYFGHLPLRCEENQLREYLSQFGEVKRIKLPRSKSVNIIQTNRPKGYAFVEFEDEEIASIVVNTMNDYLMFGKRIQCKVLLFQLMEPQKVSSKLFKNCNKKMKLVPRHLIHAKLLTKVI